MTDPFLQLPTRLIRIMRPKTPRSSTIAAPTSSGRPAERRRHLRPSVGLDFSSRKVQSRPLAPSTESPSAPSTPGGGGDQRASSPDRPSRHGHPGVLASGRAAAAQPERRTATSPSAAAAAAAVAVEADFDNDGFADLAVGVPREGSAPPARRRGDHPGRVGHRPDRRRQPTAGPRRRRAPDTAEPFDFFGNALAAGDFNDGFIDLAIGAPAKTWPPSPTPARSPCCTVRPADCQPPAASSSPRTPQGCWALPRPRMASAPPLGRGLQQRQPRRPGHRRPAEGVGGAAQAGAVNVLYGATGGLTATGNQQWLQGSGGIGGVAEVGDQFNALTSGDFNNDTFGDLAIGAPSKTSAQSLTPGPSTSSMAPPAG